MDETNQERERRKTAQKLKMRKQNLAGEHKKCPVERGIWQESTRSALWREEFGRRVQKVPCGERNWNREMNLRTSWTMDRLRTQTPKVH